MPVEYFDLTLVHTKKKFIYELNLSTISNEMDIYSFLTLLNK